MDGESSCSEFRPVVIEIGLFGLLLQLLYKNLFHNSNQKTGTLYNYFELSGACMLIYILCTCKLKACLFVWKIINN